MKHKNLLLTVSAVLLLFLFTASLALAAPVGKVTLVAGKVDVLKPGKNLATPVKLGDPVDVGDIYRAKTKSNAEITFNNQNILKIAPATRVEINEYMVDEQKSSQVIKLHRGRVQAISGQDFIKKVAAFAEGNRFEVHTPNAVAGIRGSNMLVGFTQGTTVIIFIAGHGYLYNPQMPQLITPIIAGQMSFISGEGTPSMPMKASEALISGGGEAFIQIEPIKETMEEPPTVSTSFTVLDPVPPPLVTGTNFTGITDFIEDPPGTFTGYLPYQGIGTMSASGPYSGTGVPSGILQGWLLGTSDKGGAFSGPIAGIQGSLLTRMAAFYVEGNNLYFLTGDASGTYDGATFAISGSLGKSGSVGTVTLLPNPYDPTLLGALEYSIGNGEDETPQFFSSGTIISDSGIQITSPSFGRTARYLITNEGRKVSVIDNIYTGYYASTTTTALPYLGYIGEDGEEYALGPLFYSHDTANSRFTIDIPALQSIGYLWYSEDDKVPSIGMYSMRYFGKYEGSNFRMAGAGTYVGTPANFFGYWNATSLYYNNSGVMENAGEDFGLFGGTTPPWSSPASFIAIGEYTPLDPSDKPHYLMNTDISGGTTEAVSGGGTIDGYAGAIWKGGSSTTVGTISDGTVRALYVSTPVDEKVTAGIMKGTFAGSYYDISPTPMWGISGTLTPTPVSIDLNPDDLEISEGSISGALSGNFGGTGIITGLDDGNGKAMFLYNNSTGQSLPFGIFNIRFGNSDSPNSYSGKPEGNTSWSAALGGTGTFGYSSLYSDEEGYWLATVAGTWTDSGEIGGNVTGKALTPLHLYDMEGNVTGVNSGSDGTWIGQAIGSYTGTPTDFGGNWYHDGLYNVEGTFGPFVENEDGYYLEGDSYGEGVFGFLKRTDGNYNFLAIGEFTDYYGYVEHFGGPYILSGVMYYSSPTENRYLEAFTSGIWNKVNPSDTSGTIAGYTAAVYYTEDGKVGLIKGNLAGNFYDMYYNNSENYTLGIWQVQSGTGGLTTIDKTASLPEDFDVTGASISYKYLSAQLAGGFAGSTENTIFGESFSGTENSYGGIYYSKTKFITYADGEKSLPFGIYNLKLGGVEPYSNFYSDKPTDTPSVSWSAKIGGEGGFGVNSSDEGYWLANIGSTWDEYSPDPGHGTINGTLSGKYITQTHLGTIGGPFYGLYTGVESGTWVGMSIGTYEGTPLTSSLKFSTTDATPTKLWRAVTGDYYEAEFVQRIGDREYYYGYEYIKTTAPGMGYGNVEDDYYDIEKIYFPNGNMWKDQDGMISMEDWSGQVEDQVRTLPSGWMDPNDPTFTPTWYSKWPSFIDVLENRASDTLDAMLGMTGYPWNTGGTPVYVIGKYTAFDSDYSKPTIITIPSLFGTFYSDYVEGGTPNGAYVLYPGGFITDDTRGVQLAMRGLYTDGTTAGVLRHSPLLTGSLYKDIGMWDAEGGLVATVMNSNFTGNPEEVTISNFSDNIIDGSFASEFAGRFTGDSGSFFGTMVNSGGTHFIKGQDWGIFTSTIWVGGFGISTGSTIPGTWSAQIAGKGEFGEYKDAYEAWKPDLGLMLIPALSGTFSGGVVKAPPAGTGQFMTMTKMGTISDVGVLGVYTQPSPVTPKTLYSWQGVSGGVWNTTQYFTFASQFDGSVNRFTANHSGGYSDGSYNQYYYWYNNEARYGDISFFSDADRTYITRRTYETDSDPFATPMWYEYKYEKGTNTFSEYTTGTDYPSSFSDAFFSALAVEKEYPAYNQSSDWWGFYGMGSISAIMGGAGDLWSATSSSPATVYFLGDYDNWYGKPINFGAEIESYNVKNPYPSSYEYTTLDGKGAYYGYIGGHEIDGTIGGGIRAIYLKDIGGGQSEAGILLGSFTGQVYEDAEMWQGQGTIYPVYLMNKPISYTSLMSNTYVTDLNSGSDGTASLVVNETTMGGTKPFDYAIHYMALYDETAGSFGVWRSGIGAQGINPGASWTASFEYIDPTKIIGNDIAGTTSSNVLTGSVIGYGADLNPPQPATWVSVGNVKGTFDPTLFAFQIGAIGVSIETNTYLNLVQTNPDALKALNIPTVQVGVDTLTGNGNGFMDVNNPLAMNNVRFFAPSSGGKPTIWATNSVTGNYTASPILGTAISLTGVTLKADFTFKQWNTGSGRWLGSVDGTGGFNGSTTFKGAAAGTGAQASGSGSILGTAAGVAR